jgi:hypothetical protein
VLSIMFFFLRCSANNVFSQNVLSIMFFPRMFLETLNQVRSKFLVRRLPCTNHNTPLVY